MVPAAALRYLAAFLAAGLATACSEGGSKDSSSQMGAGPEVVAVGTHQPAGPKLAFNAQKAHFDYQMNCQGCHGPDGAGSAKRGVPSLDDLDRFQKLPEGREFLIRVPGMSRSPLSNADLANLANWMMEEFAGTDGTVPFEPFEEAEVARLRDNPIVDGVVEHRAKLVARLDAVPKS